MLYGHFLLELFAAVLDKMMSAPKAVQFSEDKSEEDLWLEFMIIIIHFASMFITCLWDVAWLLSTLGTEIQPMQKSNKYHLLLKYLENMEYQTLVLHL